MSRTTFIALLISIVLRFLLHQLQLQHDRERIQRLQVE